MLRHRAFAPYVKKLIRLTIVTSAATSRFTGSTARLHTLYVSTCVHRQPRAARAAGRAAHQAGAEGNARRVVCFGGCQTLKSTQKSTACRPTCPHRLRANREQPAAAGLLRVRLVERDRQSGGDQPALQRKRRHSIRSQQPQQAPLHGREVFALGNAFSSPGVRATRGRARNRIRGHRQLLGRSRSCSAAHAAAQRAEPRWHQTCLAGTGLFMGMGPEPGAPEIHATAETRRSACEVFLPRLMKRCKTPFCMKCMMCCTSTATNCVK